MNKLKMNEVKSNFQSIYKDSKKPIPAGKILDVYIFEVGLNTLTEKEYLEFLQEVKYFTSCVKGSVQLKLSALEKYVLS